MGDHTAIPKLKLIGSRIYEGFKANPWALLIIIVLLLTILYLYPIKTVLFTVTVTVSIIMAAIMHIILGASVFERFDLKPMEKALISGGFAGITGFIIGTYTEIQLISRTAKKLLI